MPLRPDLRSFPDLSYHVFQHPSDSQAIAALQKVPGLPKVIKYLSEKSIERMILIEKISCCLRVNAEQYPSLYKQYIKLAEVLDVRKLPALYIQSTDGNNAFAMGMENYTIVIGSGLVDSLTEEEMLAILGQELGHVKCEHQLYKTLAFILTDFGSEFIKQIIPLVGSFLSLGMELAILDWNRKAKLSADRASLLAVQDVEVVSSALGKLAGYSKKYGDEFNVDAIEKQADEYQDLGDNSVLVKMLKLYSMIQQTHPYPVVRLKEIRRWAKSPEFENIMKGEYARGSRTLVAADRVANVVSTPRARECPNPKCLMLWDDYNNFCAQCQTNLRSGRLLCTNCRHQVDPNWRVCSSCGTHLTQPSAGALPPQQ